MLKHGTDTIHCDSTADNSKQKEKIVDNMMLMMESRIVAMEIKPLVLKTLLHESIEEKVINSNY